MTAPQKWYQNIWRAPCWSFCKIAHKILPSVFADGIWFQDKTHVHVKYLLFYIFILRFQVLITWCLFNPFFHHHSNSNQPLMIGKWAWTSRLTASWVLIGQIGSWKLYTVVPFPDHDCTEFVSYMTSPIHDGSITIQHILASFCTVRWRHSSHQVESERIYIMYKDLCNFSQF